MREKIIIFPLKINNFYVCLWTFNVLVRNISKNNYKISKLGFNFICENPGI